MITGELFVSGVRLLLTVLFLHRCIVIYERWSLGRTEKFQYSEALAGMKPFPAFSWNKVLHEKDLEIGNYLRDFVCSAIFFNGTHQM